MIIQMKIKQDIFKLAIYSRSSIGGSGSRKTNSLLNLIKNQLDIDKIYLYAKDWFEAKYQFLINKRESIFLYPINNIQDIYKNIDE